MSWKGTCALSNLPIPYRTPVRGVPLFSGTEREIYIGQPHGQHRNGMTKPSELWRPVAWTIRGKMSDTGGMLGAWAAQEPIWERALFHAVGYELSPKNFVARIRRETLKSQHKMWPDSSVGCCFIREDVWELVKSLNTTAELGFRGAFTYARYEDLPKKWVADYQTHQAEYESDDIRTSAHAWVDREMRFLSDPVMADIYHHQKLFDSFLFHRVRGKKVSFLDDPVRDPQISLAEAEAVVSEVADILYVQTVMDCLRRFWSPQAGLGSEETFYRLHSEFLDGISTIAKRKGSLEEDGEEDDELDEDDEDDD